MKTEISVIFRDALLDCLFDIMHSEEKALTPEELREYLLDFADRYAEDYIDCSEND